MRLEGVIKQDIGMMLVSASSLSLGFGLPWILGLELELEDWQIGLEDCLTGYWWTSMGSE